MSLERLYYQIISPDRKPVWEPLFRLLKLASVVYGWIHQLRLWAYRTGCLKAKRLDCRVISVGNLTLGGTGKSPMVMKIVRLLKERGFHPAILSRGYGRMVKEQVQVVNDGQETLLDPRYAGDEAVMMGKILGDIPILIGPNRYLTGGHAIERFGVDTLVLDDGYQHVQLERDVNILLVDAENPLGNGNLLPAGVLRESAEQMNRADLIILTRARKDKNYSDLPLPVTESIPVLRAGYCLQSVIRLDNEEEQFTTGDAIVDQPVAAFCGIADPDSFRDTVESSGARLVHFEVWPDHHPFTPDNLCKIVERAIDKGAKMIWVTEKDAVKLEPSVSSLPIYKVAMQVDILDDQEQFERIIEGNSEDRRATPAGNMSKSKGLDGQDCSGKL